MAQWAAGERVTASKMSTTRLSAICTTALTVTTTVTDISGLTHTFTTTRDNVEVDVTACLDIEALGTDPVTGAIVANLDVDGTDESSQLIWNAGTDTAANDGVRGMATQTWVVTLVTAGSHTIKMQANRVGGTADDARINATHSTLKVVVEDNV